MLITRSIGIKHKGSRAKDSARRLRQRPSLGNDYRGASDIAWLIAFRFDKSGFRLPPWGRPAVSSISSIRARQTVSCICREQRINASGAIV